MRIVFMMCTKDECPDYLINSEKVIFWDVEDPKGTSYEFHLNIKNQIKSLVQSLMSRTFQTSP